MPTCCKYNAGMLRTKITIQEKTRVADGQGGYTTAWTDVAGAPTRAYMVAAPGNERWNYMRQQPGNTYRVITRYFSVAGAGLRILVGTTEYAVLGAVDPDLRRLWTDWRVTDGEPS